MTSSLASRDETIANYLSQVIDRDGFPFGETFRVENFLRNIYCAVRYLKTQEDAVRKIPFREMRHDTRIESRLTDGYYAVITYCGDPFGNSFGYPRMGFSPWNIRVYDVEDGKLYFFTSGTNPAVALASLPSHALQMVYLLELDRRRREELTLMLGTHDLEFAEQVAA
jgi:hypothetical protein